MINVLIAIIGYLIGSVSFSILLSLRRFHVDVRTQGSGNAGSTNVARSFGMRFGLITLGCDIVKSLAALIVGDVLNGAIGVAVAGIAAICGHCFPVFYKFKGGKGVSVLAAIVLYADWRVFLIALSVFLAVVLLTRYVSLGSIAACLSLAPICLILGLRTSRLVLLTVCGLIVIIMHHTNIVRLLRGEESKFVIKKAER